MLKKVFTTKVIIIPISIVTLILLATGIVLFINKWMTPLEKVKVTEDASKVVYNIDEVIERDYSDESYVMFALETLKQTKNSNTFTIYEVRDTINNFFDVNFDLDRLNKTGLTPYMVERGVTFDTSSMSYTYNKSYTRVDINGMKIVKYDLKKVSKKSNSKYVITYDKYVVTAPYNIYNYYLSKSNSQETIDIISKYLKGEGQINKIKDLITKDNINEIGSVEGKLMITYKLTDNKLQVTKIEKK